MSDTNPRTRQRAELVDIAWTFISIALSETESKATGVGQMSHLMAIGVHVLNYIRSCDCFAEVHRISLV